ncbi:MAG: hypothetical protein ACLQI7_03775 [Streptosporangiaceae bacterium]
MTLMTIFLGVATLMLEVVLSAMDGAYPRRRAGIPLLRPDRAVAASPGLRSRRASAAWRRAGRGHPSAAPGAA